MGRPALVKKSVGAIAVNTSAPEKKVGEVADAAGKLYENVNYLLNSLDALADRLEPVLSGETPEDLVGGTRLYGSRLAQEISSETSRVIRANERINILLARLEL